MSRLLRREDGFALLLSLGLTVVLTILVIAMIGYTSSSSSSSRTSGARVKALAFAEAGITEAASIINSASNASAPNLLGCTTDGSISSLPCTDYTIAQSGGTTSFHGMFSVSGSTGVWTLTSVGTVPNPSPSGEDLHQTMRATMSVVGGGQSNNISVWNYVYSTADPSAGCEVDLSGTQVSIDVPIYVTGDLCLSGTQSSITENTATGGQPVDVRVGGTLKYIGTQSTVGTSANKITSGIVSGGCITTGNPTPHTCTPPSDAWYVKTADTPITATPPTVDFPTWYQNASPGPKNICSTSLTPSPNLTATTNKFDNDTTMNGTNTSFNLTPSSDYNCVTPATSDCPSGQMLNWNHSTHLLTVCGTMFFDGNVTINDSSAMYHGKATIYVNGTVSFSGATKTSLHAGCPASPSTPTHQCAFSDTLKEWDPNKDMLILLANKNPGTAIDLSGTQNEFQGGLWCSKTSTAALSGTQTKVEGPIICGRFSWGTQTKLLPLPTISNLPPGAPVPPNAPATITPPVITG